MTCRICMQGGEYDVVKPLLQEHVIFRGQVWCVSTSTSGLAAAAPTKSSASSLRCTTSEAATAILRNPDPTPIVEACTIIEEPLSQYRTGCAFCPASFDILHPKGCRKFVCGNDKDRVGQRLVKCRHMNLDL
uniref:Uncharacterized protein n=1 Tax=Setaria viridis TaxID=4556 RepID=A0A4U6UTR5_SETVI|nr:hypothetical protein SEVIR_4G056800v2 [Setaria viridis]